MSKYDLPAKTNTKIQCVCFLWVRNFVGNSMGTDGIRTHSDKGIFDRRVNYHISQPIRRTFSLKNVA